jgi:uncharacterized protein
MQSSLQDPLGGTDIARWDELAGENFYSSGTWLRYCAANNRGLSGAALSVGDTGIQAAVPLTETSVPPSGLYDWNGLLKEFGLPLIAPTGIMLGVFQGYQGHLLRARDADPVKTAADLVGEALRLRDGLPGGSERACVATYLTTPDVRALRDAGVSAFPVLLDADAWIEVPEGGWDAWLQTFSYKRQVAIRREVRRFEEAGYRITHQPLRTCYGELAQLAKATQSKYGHSEDVSFYAGLMKAHVDGMGDAARAAILSRPDGTLVAFCIYYMWQGTVYLRWAGFDYDKTAKANEYFNLVYYDQIKRSPLSGARRLHAGIKAVEAKALRGASLRPLWLLDLDPHSPLAGAEPQIREHNRRLFGQYSDDARTAPALADRDAWTVYT